MSTLAERVRQRREALGLSQYQVDRAMGLVGRSNITNKIERGKDLRPRHLSALAAALGSSPAWLELGVHTMPVEPDVCEVARALMQLPHEQRAFFRDATDALLARQALGQ